jgi:hypothetical protein
VGAAAAVNPLLIPARTAVTYLVERWADEEAADAVSDRDLVARTVARAALATIEQSPAPALGLTGGVIVRRVSALQRPPFEAGRRLLVAVAVAAAAGVPAGLEATTDFVEVVRAWLS